jgi:large subunit ribosomal protein L18
MRTSKCRFEIRRNRVRSKLAAVSNSNRPRLSVFKSGRHVYAQIIDDSKSSTIVAASTLDKEIKQTKKSNCNVNSAEKVGELLAERASGKGVIKVAFDKGGYKYHGIIKALANGARKKLEF